jgi:hypothetical protein
MNKLINLTELFTGLRRAWQQYPESNVAAFVAFVAASMLSMNKPDTQLWAPILWAALLGLPLGFALAARRIQTQAKGWIAWLPTLLATVALVAYGFWVDTRYEVHFVRFFVLNAVAHLAVAVAPFLKPGVEAAFWHYNRRLLMRALLTGIYAATMLIGVMAALLALKVLFKVELYDEQYQHTVFFCAFVLNTAVYTAGAPTRFDEETTEETYPLGLLNFVQYILLPLVTVYLLILYAFGVSVIFGEAPEGINSYLVIAFSVVGVLGLLLAFPLRESATKGWIRWFTRLFYPLLLPLVALLFYAIWLRVSDYGLTEKRVLLLYLGLWLGGIALYFTLRRRVDIKLIPLSLAVISLVAAVGPLSIGDLSRVSQNARLNRILTDAGLLKDGAYQRPSTMVRDSVAMEITSIVDYFQTMHGLSRLNSWAKPMVAAVDSAIAKVDTLEEYRNRFIAIDTLLDQMNVELTWHWVANQKKDANPRFSYELRTDNGGENISIDNNWVRAWYINFNPDITHNYSTSRTFSKDGLIKENGDFAYLDGFNIRTSFRSQILKLYAQDSISYSRFFTSNDTSFVLRQTSGPWQLEWRLTHLDGTVRSDSLRLTQAKGILYLRKR